MATVIEGRESGFKTNPDYKVLLEPSPRRVRVQFNGEWVADSTNAHLLFEKQFLVIHLGQHSHTDRQFVNALHGEVLLPIVSHGLLCLQEFHFHAHLSLCVLGNDFKTLRQIG